MGLTLGGTVGGLTGLTLGDLEGLEVGYDEGEKEKIRLEFVKLLLLGITAN